MYYDSNRQHELKHTLNFLVSETKQHSLLSLKACIDFSLITVNDSVHMVADEPLENILAEYDGVFKGIGCLSGEYDLEIVHHTSACATEKDPSFHEGGG